MLFNIAAGNKDRAGKAFTTERTPKTYGYKQSAILTPKNKRLSYSYQIDIIDNTCIVCTVRHIDTQSLFAIVKLSNYTAESIEVEHGELYRNCSPYPYRRECNDKYLKKYDQIACIVHGAITAGLLFDTAEATTSSEITTDAENTTAADTEPQEATESAETTEPDTTEAETESAAPEYGYTGETSEQFTPEELDMMNKGAQIKHGDGYSRAAYFSTPYRDGVRLVYRATIYNDTDEPAPGTDAKYCGFTIGLDYYDTTAPAAAQMADDINAEIMRTIPTEQAAEQNAGDLDESEKNRLQSIRSASYERDAERHYIDSTAPTLRLYHADRTPSAAAVIRYLLNPAEVVREIATEYTKSHRAEILRQYIHHNRTAAALEEIKRNKAHRAHTLRAIHEATKGYAAKSYRVTLTNGATISIDADAVQRMAYNGNIPAWYVLAQDRDQLRKDERGRAQDIQPQEVRRISHGGRVVWAA